MLHLFIIYIDEVKLAVDQAECLRLGVSTDAVQIIQNKCSDSAMALGLCHGVYQGQADTLTWSRLVVAMSHIFCSVETRSGYEQILLN
jgi:hypothetical protein